MGRRKLCEGRGNAVEEKESKTESCASYVPGIVVYLESDVVCKDVTEFAEVNVRIVSVWATLFRVRVGGRGAEWEEFIAQRARSEQECNRPGSFAWSLDLAFSCLARSVQTS